MDEQNLDNPFFAWGLLGPTHKDEAPEGNSSSSARFVHVPRGGRDAACLSELSRDTRDRSSLLRSALSRKLRTTPDGASGLFLPLAGQQL